VNNIFIIFSVCIISVRELHGLHDKYLNRPTLDDNVDEEHAIDILTQEITHVCICNLFVCVIKI